jgi:cytochrome c oxidase assembly factor 2
MPPHLHPRSRSTTGLFAGTLLASLMVVGIPHVFPCPAPRRTFADSEMIMTADGQQIQRVRRRRRKDGEATTQDECMPARTPLASEEEVSTFLQLEEEAALLSNPGRECPVPKPTGMLGDLLGFSKRPFTQTPQTENRQPDVEGRRSQ